MTPFSPSPKSFPMSWPWQQKPNLPCSTSPPGKWCLCTKASLIGVACNQNHQSKLTTLQQSALPTTQSASSKSKCFGCIYIGSAAEKLKANTVFTGLNVKTILSTTTLNTIHQHTTLLIMLHMPVSLCPTQLDESARVCRLAKTGQTAGALPTASWPSAMHLAHSTPPS